MDFDQLLAFGSLLRVLSRVAAAPMSLANGKEPMLHRVEPDLTDLLRQGVIKVAHRIYCRGGASACKSEQIAAVGQALLLIAEEIFEIAPSLGARRMSNAASRLWKKAAGDRRRGYLTIMPRYVARHVPLSRREATAARSRRKVVEIRAWPDLFV
jgi:hypothetical protein